MEEIQVMIKLNKVNDMSNRYIKLCTSTLYYKRPGMGIIILSLPKYVRLKL